VGFEGKTEKTKRRRRPRSLFFDLGMRGSLDRRERGLKRESILKAGGEKETKRERLKMLGLT